MIPLEGRYFFSHDQVWHTQKHSDTQSDSLPPASHDAVALSWRGEASFVVVNYWLSHPRTVATAGRSL